MMTHEQLLEMWQTDAGINKTTLDDEALNIPKLHHKYLQILMEIRSKKIAYQHKLEDLKKDKELYYSGQAEADVYKEKPFDLKILKPDVDKYLESDDEYVLKKTKVDYLETIVNYLDQVLRQIQNRTFQIKNAIEWKRFTSGAI